MNNQNKNNIVKYNYNNNNNKVRYNYNYNQNIQNQISNSNNIQNQNIQNQNYNIQNQNYNIKSQNPPNQNYNIQNQNQPLTNQINQTNKSKKEIKKQDDYKPTFANRLFGLPSNDEISLFKFKLKIMKIVLICIIIVIITLFFAVKGFTFRTTKIVMEYEDTLYLPSIGFYLLSNTTSPRIRVYKSNSLTSNLDQILIEVYNNRIINGTDVGCFDFFPSMNFYNIKSDCIASKEKDVIKFVIYDFELEDYFVAVLFNNQTLAVNSKYQATLGLNKIVSNGVTKYKTTTSTSSSQLLYWDDGTSERVIIYSINFLSNSILSETSQTNVQVIFGILSGVGSMITMVIMGCNVLFNIITKIYIDDPSAWVEDELRECIIYHSNQINLNNIQTNKNQINMDVCIGSTKIEKENEKDIETMSVIYLDQDTQIEDGINDNQVEFENDGEDNYIFDPNPTMEDDDSDSNDEENLLIIKNKNHYDEGDDEDNNNNNYFLLKDN